MDSSDVDFVPYSSLDGTLKEICGLSYKDVIEKKFDSVRYSPENPSFVDCENNAVNEKCLREYRTFFRIPLEIVFHLPGENAAWNPPPGCVAIYGFMFCCGVTLPIPGFIARFLSSVKCAPMKLTPNAYRNLMGLYCLWRDLNFGELSVNEIKHCLILRKSINETGSYYLGSYHPSRWMPIGEDGKRMEGKLDLPIKEDVPKKNGLIWGAPSSNKYRKGSWFFVQGNWGRKPSNNPDGMDLDIPRHFCEARTYTDQPRLTKDEAD
ncbi:hypothetical protein LWI29_031850 [Acer saccharum]|uniref:Transmembrane protein n=1 Tax=Acer saccharum TaxID=4024 RepID=A0AA39RNF3_ACESA|nr:hypothetical protein LWI29_031850 [Acer saccharum]